MNDCLPKDLTKYLNNFIGVIGAFSIILNLPTFFIVAHYRKSTPIKKMLSKISISTSSRRWVFP